MDNDVIQNMYYYLDNANNKYSKYFVGSFEIKDYPSKSDTEFSKIEIYKNGKKILIASYSVLSKYYVKDNIWIWSWSLPIQKNQNYFIKKIFDYGYNIIDKNKISQLLKDILVNSIIKITNVDFILALSIYITKSEYIYQEKKSDHLIFYLLKDIEIF
jgi:hypothetical protein